MILFFTNLVFYWNGQDQEFKSALDQRLVNFPEKTCDCNNITIFHSEHFAYRHIITLARARLLKGRVYKNS